MQAIQVLESFPKNERADAEQCFRAILDQDGCLGARLLAPTGQVFTDCWRVQAFFPTNGEYPNGWLPDGMRHVWIPVGLMRELGIK